MVVGGGGGGGGVKSFSCKTQPWVRLGWVGLWLGWGFDNNIRMSPLSSLDSHFS